MKKKLFGGLVALALALAPAAAAHADYPPGELHGVLDTYTVDPGETVTYTAPTSTYLAGEALTHQLTGVNGHTATRASFRTAPVAPTVGTFTATAQADGSHSFAFVIPSQAGANYTFEVLRADGTVWDTFDISVANPVVPPTDNGNGNGGAGGGAGNSGGNAGGNGGLAMTGSDIAVAGIAGSAVLLVGAGVVLLVVRRRRRSVESAAA
ncbi:hypothetical protein [Leifsonia sp. EB34]|uniref:hypothetical protein n=1 Tax=Leifsonia sp. EB34 TaxID=3156303 RepID=UPI0035129A0C